MTPNPIIVACAFVLAVAGVALAAGDDALPNPRHFRSQSIAITRYFLPPVVIEPSRSSGATASEVRPGMGLTLQNRTDRPLWVLVHFAAPASTPVGDSVALVRPKREVAFTCAREKIVADVDYPVGIGVFADSAFADTVELAPMRLQFDAAAVARHADREARGSRVRHALAHALDPLRMFSSDDRTLDAMRASIASVIEQRDGPASRSSARRDELVTHAALRRQGLTLEAGLGAGFTGATGFEGGSSPKAGVAMGLTLGGFVNPNLARGVRVALTTVGFPDPIFATGFAGPAAQYWTSDQVFVGGAAGFAPFGGSFDHTCAEDSFGCAGYGGIGLTARVGRTVHSRAGNDFGVIALELFSGLSPGGTVIGASHTAIAVSAARAAC